MTLLKSYTKGSQILEIFYDEDGQSSDPREYDNLGTMVCSHKQYSLGDDQLDRGDLGAYFESCDIDQSKDIAIMLPLWLYDHSGISMSCGDRVYPFNDQWDSGLVGYIYVTKKKLKAEFGKRLTKKFLDRIEGYLQEEVKTYDLFLRGEVFNFTISETNLCNLEHEHKEIIDSCGGFIGIDNTIECLTNDYKLNEWNEA